MKYCVVSSVTKRGQKLWSVPSLSHRSLLFSSARWHAAVVYAMLRGDGLRHQDAVRLAWKSTPDFRV